MSEIQDLLNRIADMQAQIRALREEKKQGEDFVKMISDGAETSNLACKSKRRKKSEFFAVESESTFANSLGERVNSNYGQTRQDNIQDGFDEIIKIAEKRISDIETEINSLNNEISLCNSRIEAIRQEEERKRKQTLGY
ncbi:MAG: hypothetical protein K6D38_09185 [Pseudobutyrivibrio sp.]|nr:hypothetical protein [Pseudobutyrivibrio sp.]